MNLNIKLAFNSVRHMLMYGHCLAAIWNPLTNRKECKSNKANYSYKGTIMEQYTYFLRKHQTMQELFSMILSLQHVIYFTSSIHLLHYISQNNFKKSKQKRQQTKQKNIEIVLKNLQKVQTKSYEVTSTKYLSTRDNEIWSWSTDIKYSG